MGRVFYTKESTGAAEDEKELHKPVRDRSSHRDKERADRQKQESSEEPREKKRISLQEYRAKKSAEGYKIPKVKQEEKQESDPSSPLIEVSQQDSQDTRRNSQETRHNTHRDSHDSRRDSRQNRRQAYNRRLGRQQNHLPFRTYRYEPFLSDGDLRDYLGRGRRLNPGSTVTHYSPGQIDDSGDITITIPAERAIALLQGLPGAQFSAVQYPEGRIAAPTNPPPRKSRRRGGRLVKLRQLKAALRKLQKKNK